MNRAKARLQRLEFRLGQSSGQAMESLWWSHSRPPEEEIQILEILYHVGALEPEGWEQSIYRLLAQMSLLCPAGRELALGVIKWMASELSDESLDTLARECLEQAPAEAKNDLLALWNRLQEKLSGQA